MSINLRNQATVPAIKRLTLMAKSPGMCHPIPVLGDSLLK